MQAAVKIKRDRKMFRSIAKINALKVRKEKLNYYVYPSDTLFLTQRE